MHREVSTKLNQLIAELSRQQQKDIAQFSIPEINTKKRSDNLRQLFRERYREFEVTEVFPDSVISRHLKCEEIIDSYASTMNLATQLNKMIDETKHMVKEILDAPTTSYERVINCELNTVGELMQCCSHINDINTSEIIDDVMDATSVKLDDHTSEVVNIPQPPDSPNSVSRCLFGRLPGTGTRTRFGSVLLMLLVHFYVLLTIPCIQEYMTTPANNLLLLPSHRNDPSTFRASDLLILYKVINQSIKVQTCIWYSPFKETGIGP